jgi:signal transduction histidine kinase
MSDPTKRSAQRAGLQDDARTGALILLRWVLIVATSYLVVFSRPLGDSPIAAGIFVATYFASNIILAAVLPRFPSRRAFDLCVVLLDAAMVTVGLTLSGAVTTEFYVMYFLVLFLSALTERLGLVVLAATLVSLLHLYAEGRLVGTAALLAPAYLLRVPFLFVVAMFFGSLVREARGREHKARAARARARRMQALSEISHDLKNPLGVIQSLATLLLEGDAGPLNDAQADLVRRIHASARHVITLALNIIDAARIETGRLVLQRAPVRITDLVEDALLLARSAADLKHLPLESSIAPDLPAVHLDAVQMERVVSNIVGNAIKFTPAGGSIRLRGERRGDQIVLTVTDTGIGIPAAELPLLFERYRRRGRHADGSGLGLFIVKGIVDAHGGSVSVDSVVGQGTAVTVRLPLRVRASDELPAALSHASERLPDRPLPVPARSQPF